MDVEPVGTRRHLRRGGAPLPVVGRARVYVCGITPYAVTHLGHAATFLWADLAVRVWRSVGVEVEVARNVTDVDDALFEEARRTGVPYDRLAALARFRFDRTMSALDVRRPDHEPTARTSVDRVIELAQALLDVGGAYRRGGTVYAATAAAATRLGLTRQEALRLAADFGDDPDDPDRDDPLDVAVWRAVGGGEAVDGGDEVGTEVSWPSPWGAGRPGWHAECAAMVLSTFGPSVDLHCGGVDLRFPHHAVESLLAEQATGVRPFARSWLHAGAVRVNGAKMAKSTGNLVFADNLIDRHGAAAVRLLCLARDWRVDWDYSDADFDQVHATLDRLYVAAGRTAGSAAATTTEGGAPAAGAIEVEQALLDDLDTPRALAVALDAGGIAARRFIGVLGLAS